MVFIETSLFTRLIAKYLTEDEYVGLQSFLLQRPDAGAIIPGQGVFGNSVGEFLARAKVVASGLSIIGMSVKMKSGS